MFDKKTQKNGNKKAVWTQFRNVGEIIDEAWERKAAREADLELVDCLNRFDDEQVMMQVMAEEDEAQAVMAEDRGSIGW